MTARGTILLADDEPVFAQATADLLRREGYAVDTVADAPSALAATAAKAYDLVISDLEMPGNDDLALLRRLAESNGGLPVIVITGYPSVRSAIACIDLPVAAYLTKPVEFPVLKERVEAAVRRYRAWQAMRRSEERLRSWQDELGQAADLGISRPGLDSFLALTLRNVMGSLSDIQEVGQAIIDQPNAPRHACQLMNCPRGSQLQAAVQETINVLETTKGSFKSKVLGDLRHRLELLLRYV
jgi:CheY-like chemotaxis protein